MKRFSTLAICFIVLSSLYAGNPIGKWYHGSVVLSNQQVVVGDISVYPVHHLIMFRTDKGTTVFSADKIESFFFYDAAANVNRKFVSHINHESVIPQYQLYEVVLAGTIPVWRRQLTMSRGTNDAHDFDYFFLHEKQLIELRKFKRLVYPKISKQSEELVAFVKKGNLNPGQPGNAIEIIRYYNLHRIHDAVVMN